MIYRILTIVTIATAVSCSDAPPPREQPTQQCKKSGGSQGGSGPYLNLQDGERDLWAEVKQTLQNKCVSCHAGYDEFDTVKSKFDSYVALMDRENGDPQLMPKNGQKLSLEERTAFLLWKGAGWPRSGSGSGGGTGSGGGSDSGQNPGGDLGGGGSNTGGGSSGSGPSQSGNSDC